MSTELHFEFLVGRLVCDSEGEPVGRLEDARTQRQGEELVVVEYRVGAAAMLEHFSIRGMGRATLRLLGIGRRQCYVIPWQVMDLAHPGGPRCSCRRDELAPFFQVIEAK